MDRDKERQEISLVGRLLSLEALLVLMGALSLFSGVMAADPVRIASGLAILAALCLLLFRRRQKHRQPKARHKTVHERKSDEVS
jgi:hypothetical protein